MTVRICGQDIYSNIILSAYFKKDILFICLSLHLTHYQLARMRRMSIQIGLDFASKSRIVHDYLFASSPLFVRAISFLVSYPRGQLERSLLK